MMSQIFFWFSLYLVFHTYVFYPERMRKKADNYTPRTNNPTAWPRIDLLIAAYNEEEIIDQKIESCLNSDYPAELIRIVIGSDCSSDLTDAKVAAWTKKDSRVMLRRFNDRTGKPQIINQLVRESQAEVLVLSDADTLFEYSTLKELVRPFADATIGGIQARFLSETDAMNDVARQELSYNDRELTIKKGQSADGAVIGAYGACYALRRNLYQEVPKGFLVDDFYIFMKVLEMGFRTEYAENAVCRLEVSGESAVEFKRKVRIGMGNYQNFFALSAFWNPFKNVDSSYYWSYKVLRWFTPFLLIFILLSNICLAPGSFLYSVILLFQVLIYALWPADLIFKKFGITLYPLRYVRHFMRMNLALLLGFFRFLRGGATGTWN